MKGALVLVLVLPLTGCWWMMGDDMQSSVRVDVQPEFDIQNPNDGVLYEVTEVIDGNSIRVSGYSTPIQLIGIQAPGHTKTWNDFYTKDAYLHLKKLLLGREVSLYDDLFDELPFRVWRGKILAYVFLNGRLVNRHLLEHGYARVEPDHAFHRRLDFLRAEAQAKENRAGLWRANP